MGVNLAPAGIQRPKTWISAGAGMTEKCEKMAEKCDGNDHRPAVRRDPATLL
jgi:hypothetical protein